MAKPNETSNATEMHLNARGFIFSNARRLRNELTPAEALLWECIRKKKIENTRFRQQHPMLHYILDFYCVELKLGIELDGGYHFTPEQQDYDARRSEQLAVHGVRIVRFTNEAVFEKTDWVVEEIGRVIREMRSSP
jgi:very-short-patch-repair endonuclease